MATCEISVTGQWAEVRGGDYTVIDRATRFRPEGYVHNTKYKMRLWDGWIHLARNASSSSPVRIPAGLADRTGRALTDAGYEVTRRDLRKKRDELLSQMWSKPELHGGIELRDMQFEAIDAAVNATRGIIKASTGYGKTVTMIGLISRIDCPTIIFVHSNQLMHQTFDAAKKMLKLKDGEIGMIGDSVYAPGSFLTIAMFQTAAKAINGRKTAAQKKTAVESLRAGRMSTEAYEDFLDDATEAVNAYECMQDELARYDCVIVDEAHHASTAKTWAKVVEHCPAFWRFGFSATPFKEPPGTELQLIGATGEIVYEYTVDQAIEDGISVEPYIYVVNYPQIWLNDGLSYAELYTAAIVQNGPRNDAIEDICLSADASGLKTLVVVERIEHGEEIARRTGWPFVSGDSYWTAARRKRVVKQLNSGKISGIISTVMGEGVDIPNLSCVVLASGGKARHLATQRVGRGIRKGEKDYCLVFDFNDEANRVMERQTKQRIKAYEDNTFIVRHAKDVPDIKAIVKKLEAKSA